MKFKKIDNEKQANLLNQINDAITALDKNDLEKEASLLHNIFIKVSKLPTEKSTGHKSAPKGYPEKAKLYADPVNFKYPIDTEEHARAAWSYIHQARNRKGYSSDELSSMEARIRKQLKKYDVDIKEPKDAHK